MYSLGPFVVYRRVHLHPSPKERLAMGQRRLHQKSCLELPYACTISLSWSDLTVSLGGRRVLSETR